MRSRTTLATMEAAAIEAIVASPFTTASTVQELRRIVPVDERQVRPARQGREGAAHGPERSLADVDGVDRVVGHGADADLRGGENGDEERLATGSRQDLRIGEALGHPERIEHHGGRDDPDRRGSAADLVEAGDARAPHGAEGGLAFEAEAGRYRANRCGHGYDTTRPGEICHPSEQRKLSRLLRRLCEQVRAELQPLSVEAEAFRGRLESRPIIQANGPTPVCRVRH